MVERTQKYCSPRCRYFRCSRRALTFRGGKAWCKFAADFCDPKDCKFAQCVRNKLLPNGVCELTIKAKPIELKPEEMVKPIKASGKLFQKLKERELY